MKQIDVVIPVAPKDAGKAQYCLRGILRNSLDPVRRVYIVTPEKFALATGARSGVSIHWILDAEFPFSVQDLRVMLRAKGSQHENASWYYQQLLKLYAHRVINGLLDDFLILDSDFYLTGETRFLTDDGRAILAYGYPFKWLLGTDRYPDQIEHVHADFATRLIPGWRPRHPFSGMQHHMLIQRPVLEDLFSRVEQAWGRELWQAFVDQIDVDRWCAASEYVMYHHFALWRHAGRISLRHLDARDVIFDSDEGGPDARHVESWNGSSRYRALGCHGFLELRQRLETMDYIPESLRREMLNAHRLVFTLKLEGGRLTIDQGDDQPDPGV